MIIMNSQLSNKENKPSEQILRCTFKPVVGKNDDHGSSDFSFETPKKSNSNIGGGELLSSSLSNSGSGSGSAAGSGIGGGGSIADHHHLYSTPLSKVSSSSNDSKHADHSSSSSAKKIALSPLNAASADHDVCYFIIPSFLLPFIKSSSS